MPIVFEQPQPVSPIYGQGSAADVMTRDLPVLARLLEGYGHQGGGGSGHVATDTQNYVPQQEQQSGGGGRGGGYGGVSPAGSFYAGDAPDYVGQHIQQQQAFQLQRDRERRAAQLEIGRQLNSPPAQSQQPMPMPTFDANDQIDLAKAQKFVSELQGKYEVGELSPDNPSAQAEYAQAQQKIAGLQQKQQAATRYARDQALKQQTEAAAHADTLTVQRTQHFNGTMQQLTPPDQIPGVPAKHYSLDDKGVWKLDNGPERVEFIRAFHVNEQKRIDMQAKQPELQAKADEVEEKHFGEDRKLAHAELLKEKGKDAKGNQVAPTDEEIHERAAAIGQKRLEAREQRGLERNADPKVRAAYLGHLESLPQTEGKVDYNQASNKQLADLGGFLKDPKPAGIAKKQAEEGIAKIRKILEDRIKPPPIVSPPPLQQSSSYMSEAATNARKSF